MDLSKMQFLVTEGLVVTTIQKFRRKSQTMLFQGDKPLRLCTWGDWQKLQDTWPDHVKRDQLTLRTVWTLIPA